MKKIVFVLLLAVLEKKLPAQISYYPSQGLASESIFNSPPPGTLSSHFDFILPNNNRMIIEVNRIGQLQQLPNLDSLFKKIWADLEPLQDSLADPLQVRRIDYVATRQDARIRIKQYPSSGNYFSYKDDELVQLKVDQDTLRFKGYNETGRTMTINNSQITRSEIYTVTLLLNNIADVAKLPAGLLQSGVALLMKDIAPSLQRPALKTKSTFYYALYNLQTQKKVAPLKPEHLGFGKPHGLQPYVQAGIQYGRGSWMTSVGPGLEYYYNKTKSGQYSFRLLWEPYFFFRRNAADKLITERNDFITLKFHTDYQYNLKGKTVEFNENFSISYLASRKGDWFEPGTFKFSVPGLQAKNLLLEPEFFFNKLLKNFSPSLKLVLYVE